MVFYIVTPIIKVFIKYTTNQLLLYFLFLWFLANPLFDLINFIFEVDIYFNIPINGYLYYFVLGYFLRTHSFKKKSTITIYILAILSMMVTILGTYYETSIAGEFEDFYYRY